MVAPPLLRGVAAAALLLAVAGCSGDPAEEPTDAATASGTSLEDLDLDAAYVQRTPFCDLLADADVEAALGGDIAGSSHRVNGEVAALRPGLRDVVHEQWCTFTSEDGTIAQAWVWVPPVTVVQARHLVREAPTGCRPLADAPGFGTPSAAWTCRSEGAGRIRYAGLFGDTWLSCELTVPTDAESETPPEDRMNRWCAAVVAATTPG